MCALTALGTGPPKRVPPPVPVQESNGWEETTILKTASYILQLHDCELDACELDSG